MASRQFEDLYSHFYLQVHYTLVFPFILANAFTQEDLSGQLGESHGPRNRAMTAVSSGLLTDTVGRVILTSISVGTVFYDAALVHSTTTILLEEHKVRHTIIVSE